MFTTHPTLNIEYDKCPPECRICEDACAKEKGNNGTGLSRIKTIHAPSVDFNGVMTCVQCSQPRCLLACPAGAIEKDTKNGIVRVDESQCVGCGLCTLACPYGGIYHNGEDSKSFKCDHCDGNPKCVDACPYQILKYNNNNPTLSYLQVEDLVSTGSPACAGCVSELAMRFTLRVLGKNTILFIAPGCAATFALGVNTNAQVRIPNLPCLLTNVASTMTGVSRYYKRIGRHVQLVSFVGDGATVDAGFQALSGSAERMERFIYICNDNEGYMNTGVQRSGSTPFGAKTATTPVSESQHGKEQNSKYVPLLMLFHGVSYVATASMAFPEDYARKLTKARDNKDGMSYIHLFNPCITGWQVRENEGLEVSQLAVEANYFPLWEAEQGKLQFTYDVKNPKPIQEYTSRIGKYSHLNQRELEVVQEMVNARYDTINALASSNIAYRV